MNDGKIYGKMIAVLSDLGAISKDKKNAQQGFQYRGIDQFYNALHPLLAKHGVFTAPEVIERQDLQFTTKSSAVWNRVVLAVRYTFYADDGSSFVTIVHGEGIDSGDKATNKAMAAAHKYALMQVFAVSTEDTIDPDGETPPENTGNVQSTPKNNPKKKPGKSDAERVEDARTYFISNKPETWAKICADCGIESDMPALAMESETLQKVLAAATANAKNGGNNE